jgi:uncharacterized protein YqhQ
MIPNGMHKLMDIEKEQRPISKRGIYIAVILSYFFIVYSFAIIYLFVGNFLDGSFDNSQITFIDSLFFSFTSISVGPSGLEPNSILTKVLVMIEILIGLIYSALVFSLIASLILSGASKKDSNDNNQLENSTDL